MNLTRSVEFRLLNIVYQDGTLVVINKPAGLVCHPSKISPYSSVIGRARVLFSGGTKPNAARQPRLINRLDRETSGIVLLAMSAEGARELGRIWERREVRKEYLAVVHGWMQNEEMTIQAPIGKDPASPVAIKDCVRPDGLEALTCIKRLKCFTRQDRPFTLLSARPETGRKHQIRIHLAHIGHPVVGDKLYGADERLYLDFVHGRLDRQPHNLILPYQALHAAKVSFHWRGKACSFEAPPEPWFADFANVSPAATVSDPVCRGS